MHPTPSGRNYNPAFPHLDHVHETTNWNFTPTLSLEQPFPFDFSDMAPSTRRVARSDASGSEYHSSNHSMDVDDADAEHDDEEEPAAPVETITTRRGRKVPKKSYKESGSEDNGRVEFDEDDELDLLNGSDGVTKNRRRGDEVSEEDDVGTSQRRSGLRSLRPRAARIESDEEGGAKLSVVPTRNTRSRSAGVLQSTSNGVSSGRITRRGGASSSKRSSKQASSQQNRRRTRASARDEVDDNYVDNPSSDASGDASLDDAPHTSPEPEVVEDVIVGGEEDADGEPDDHDNDGRPYALRQRTRVNYAIPPPIEEMKVPPRPRPGGKPNGRAAGGRAKAPGWSASGAELSRWMGMGAGDDSDSDYATRTPRKNLGMGAAGGLFAGSAGTGGMLPGDFAAVGTPSNLGKVGDSALADTDPLGVNQSVTFDEVGGLDDHINALKEMTLLPLLYPEIFQRFNLTPPRGVLFHGPPGTGKTLLARALAASCRSNGKGISFFMRKGADCLSKWVGEAERQLRLLFEEAKNSQPSIIFFDEIDGLAPVRSSKQDQIHASIVSTLLALMDGMDGRGQVVVIGATNRPDAIDPALRRPGRFDREFYFPLPNLDARERILNIMTRKWAGWDDDKAGGKVQGLAKLTKGYGGADLRALCTEATLNAVQRRYPQIYKSNDRLLLNPESINVELRDFMISVKKLIPSSARATAAAAAPLPEQLKPLLEEALNRTKAAIDRVLPVSKKRTALEEAEWEDEGEEGALEREIMLQSMETLRVYRPRVVLHGSVGMGQAFIASAALHHLEGFHVQSLDLGNLLSDSTRTPEAVIVQLFVEAKRHQPSVVYIPSLLGWCAAVTETSRTTVRAMLESLSPTDPVLLLAVVDGPFASLPRDVRAWFGPTKENRVALVGATAEQREAFFDNLIKDIQRPPNQFPDGIKRKRRVLEELPVAPPLEPRAPTAAELAVQEESDRRTMLYLKHRLGPILTELKRKFKRFTKRAMEEYKDYDFENPQNNTILQQVETVVTTTTTEVQQNPNGEMVEVVNEEHVTQTLDDPMAPAPTVNGAVAENEANVQAQVLVQPMLFDMDLEHMHMDLYRDKYLTVEDFLDDIKKIVHNTHMRVNEDLDRVHRANAMYTAAEVSLQEFDPTFRHECRRMATREVQRREEYRKTKVKDRPLEDPAQPAALAAPIRRSARANGLEPELSITDPLKLERRLKRARSAEGSGAEASGEDENPAKRSRVSSQEVEGQPGEQPPSTPHRPHAVRFVDNIEEKEMPISPTPHANEPVAPFPTHETESPKRNGGFDPALLNPMSPDFQPNLYPNDSTMAGPSSMSPMMVDDPSYSNHVTPLASSQPSIPGVDQATLLPSISVDSPVMDITQPDVPPEPRPTTPQPTVSDAMQVEIERPPTPLPDFLLDEVELDRLKSDLRDTTRALNVEQLEQLRATSLALVWQHRVDWDRASLISELRTTVRDFVEEVSQDDMDADSPGP